MCISKIMADKEFNIENEYESLKKSHKLPDFKELNEEFELNSIEKKEFLIRNIRRRLNEKVIFFCRIIENLIYPSSQSPLSAYESNFFSDEKKQDLAKLHKKLMVFERQSMLLDTNPNSDGDAEYINKMHSEWDSFKKEITETVKEMKDSWHSELKDEEHVYFG